MSQGTEKNDFRQLLKSFAATIDYHRQMGLSELSIEAGQRLRYPSTNTSRREAESNESELLQLKQSLRGCTRCELHKGRRNIVFSDGSPQARLAFVGEGPGAEEDRQGLPFVGAAGQLLDKIIAAISLRRKDVYICNVVKCRPPRNRTPLPDEQSTCGPFLDRQLELVGPEVIVALGSTAANFLLKTETSMKKLRGRFHPRGEAVVMPTYHPAYLLRDPTAKRFVWEDMKMVRDRLGLPS